MRLRLTWMGHASFLIEGAGKTIFIDPYQGEYTKPVDIILISHSHLDHCDPDKVKPMYGKNTVVIAPQDCAQTIGVSIESLEPGEKTVIGNVEIRAVQAYNTKRFRSPGVPFHPKGLGVGYLITIGGKTIYHAGDTDFIREMHELKDIDIALLPCGGTYTMDPPECMDAALAIQPKTLIPIHTRDIGEDILKNEYKIKIEEKSNIKVLLLKPGIPTTLE